RPVQDPATALLVKAGHFLLYAGMVLMPVTGILTMIGNGYGWTAFGVQLAAKGDEIPWMASLGSLHSPIAWLLLLMSIGHVGIALAHLFVRMDGGLRRMVVRPPLLRRGVHHRAGARGQHLVDAVTVHVHHLEGIFPPDHPISP